MLHKKLLCSISYFVILKYMNRSKKRFSKILIFIFIFTGFCIAGFILSKSEVKAAADTCTFEGDLGGNWNAGTEGVNTNWSCSIDGQSKPGSGDRLVLPKSGTVNDLPESNIYDSIDFQYLDFVNVTGNKIKLSGKNAIHISGIGGINNDIELFADDAVIDLEARATSLGVPISGVVSSSSTNHNVVFNFKGTSNTGFKLSPEVNYIKSGIGQLNWNGNLTGNLTVREGVLFFTAHPMNIGNLNIEKNAIVRFDMGSLVTAKDVTNSGVLKQYGANLVAQNLVLNSSAHLGQVVGSPKLIVNGKSVLNSPTLDFEDMSLFGSEGLIIDNKSKESIQGFFKDLPEAKLIKVQGQVFKMTYKGGDGNDIVLLPVTYSPLISIFTEPTNVFENDNFKLKAKLTNSNSPLKNQTIDFYIDSNKVASSITNDDGIATYSVNSLALGSHKIKATYAGPEVLDKISSSEEELIIQENQPLPTFSGSKPYPKIKTTITIKDENGNTLKNVKVALTSDIYGFTDEKGQVFFENLDAGSYASKISFSNQIIDKSITVSGDNESEQFEIQVPLAKKEDSISQSKKVSSKLFLILIPVIFIVLGIGGFVLYKKKVFEKVFTKNKSLMQNEVDETESSS